MIRSRSVLTAAVLCALLLLSATTARAADDLRLGDDVAPTFQRVHLRLDPAETDYSGSVHVDLEVYAPTRAVRFHAEEMELTAVSLRDAEGAEIPTSRADLDGARVELTTEQPLAPGVYTLDVDFTNGFGTRAVGLYRAVHHEVPYLFTQLQAVDARKAFPVWDEPGFKFPYQLVLTVPADQVAVTNTPQVARHETGGTATLTFARTRPLPSYLLALAVGPFEGVEMEGLGVPGRVLAPQGQGAATAYAAEITPAILHALEEYFGTPYPYAKLDLLAVPEFWPGAMENPGLITFADGILLVDRSQSGLGQLSGLVRVTAHEVAHMWFGDLVTMEWWDDLWLNESFADWLAYKIADALYPQYEADLDQLGEVQGTMSGDARPTSEPIRQPIVYAEDAMRNVGLAYAKGRAVLGMIETWLGEETFRRGVVRYVNRHAGGNAVAADLWSSLSETSGKDVSAVLAGFLEQPGYPLIDVEPDGPGGVRISQHRFLNHGVEAPALSWRVPVRLKWSDGEAVHVEELLLGAEPVRVELGADARWVMPNAGAGGYYRWRVPEEMLLAMARSSVDALEPAERIAFLGNVASLLDAGALGGDAYLEVLSAFAHDPHPQVVSSLIGNLGKVEHAFVPDHLRRPFAIYVRRTLRPALDRFGLEARPGEAEAVTLFRPQLLGWLGEEGEDPAVRAYARDLASKHLAEPGSVDPSLAGVALHLAALDGDLELWETFRRKFEESNGPQERSRYLSALGAFRDPEIQARALEYMEDGPIRPTELFSIPGGIGDSPGGQERMFDWLVEHYEVVSGRMPPAFRAYLPYVASGCSAELLARAEEFFGQPEHNVQGTDVQLAKVAAQVNDCVNLRRREGERVARYLASLDDGGAAAGGATATGH